jgi:trimeric autotransporter adhesin
MAAVAAKNQARTVQPQYFKGEDKISQINSRSTRCSMKSSGSQMVRCATTFLLAIFALQPLANPQQTGSSASPVVPRLVNFPGKAADAQGKPLPGAAGVTFAIYKDQYEGAPLWLETQNVTADAKGYYSVQLGATKAAGLPLDLFTSGEARWLGVQVSGQPEQPRVLLLSVPYALKAADAETIGGLPPSAFVLAATAASAGPSSSTPAAGAASAAPPASSDVTTTGGTVNALPLFTSATNVQSSAITQTGTGSTAKIGVGTTAPLATLDVKGSATVRGVLTLPATGAATATAGKDSQPITVSASVFNKATGTAIPQNFRWQAEPVGNDTVTTSGSLNLLYSSGANTPAETGLKLSSKGLFTFASGQTFPGTGTVSSVATGAGLTGGPITSSGTLSVATGGITNAMLQHPSLTLTASSPLTGGGAVALGGTATLGLKTCANNQLLQFVSGAWTCANAAAGSVTSVGLNAPSSDFTVTGSPVSTSGTLTMNWVVAPTNGNTANAIVKRDSTGSFNAGAINAQSIFADGGAGSFGVYGTSSQVGVEGNSGGSDGVLGISDAAAGVHGISDTTSTPGVLGENSVTHIACCGPDGVDGISTLGAGSAIAGFASSGGNGIYGYSDSGWAGFFYGDVDVDGNLSKAGGSFKIDHPLDPANKYLYHSFVESPDMMNIYNGNVTTDDAGSATIQLPEWFETLNRDFRYQLTVMGQFAQAIVADEISNHQFIIKTDKPNVKVSWQVTGIRHDEWANAHRIPVEQEKPTAERGLYLHPELFGEPLEKAIGARRYPAVVKMAKEKANRLAATGNQ